MSWRRGGTAAAAQGRGAAHHEGWHGDPGSRDPLTRRAERSGADLPADLVVPGADGGGDAGGV